MLTANASQDWLLGVRQIVLQRRLMPIGAKLAAADIGHRKDTAAFQPRNALNVRITWQPCKLKAAVAAQQRGNPCVENNGFCDQPVAERVAM